MLELKKKKKNSLFTSLFVAAQGLQWQSTPVSLAWKIPWTEESGRLQSMGSLRVGHDGATSLSLFSFIFGEGNGNPLQCSCLENPRDGGAWWAAVYGVAQSRTQLKRLSSSSSSSKGFCGASLVAQLVKNLPEMQETPVRFLGPARSPGEGVGYPLKYSWASLVAQMVKNPPSMRKTWVWSLSWKDPLEESMATHSSILAWRIPVDRGAWRATVHGVAKSWTRLSKHSTSQRLL